MSGRIWINGSLQESAEARISPFDHGWTVGNGVFETLIAYEGKVFAFKRHWERLQHSAAVMGLPVEDEDALREACQSVLIANGLAAGRARVRITVTGGEASLGSDRGEAPTTVVVAATAVDPPATSAEVVVVPYTRNATGALAGVKATSY